MVPALYLLECAAASLARMIAAYVVSLVLALLVGVAMARNRLLERLLLPVLDILQSIPILGFFPAALAFFIAVFPGGVGPEMAAIFLIVTSLLWNMIFGVYTSVKAMEPALFDMAAAFGFRASTRFFHMYVPAASKALVANSLVSWANGWFFLTSSEVISLGAAEYRLKGLGTFVIEMFEAGDYASFYSGVAALLLVISVTYFLIWNPAYTAASGQRLPGTLAVYSAIIRAVSWLWGVLETLTLNIEKTLRMPRTVAKVLTAAALLTVAAVLLAHAASAKPPAPERLASNAVTVLSALPVSALRVTLILLLSFTLVVALAYASHRHPAAGRGIVLGGEVLASIPAIVWWPLLSSIALSYALGPYIVAAVVMLQGSLWYLYFNVLIYGLGGIRRDLEEMADVYGLRGLLYVRSMFLPSVLPSIAAGALSTWGGAWNSVIVAEYAELDHVKIDLGGAGSLLSRQAARGDVEGLLLTALAMSLLIVAVNKTIWTRFFRYVEKRYGGGE